VEAGAGERRRPGIDEQDFESIEREIGVRMFLKDIRRELKQNRYKPKPVNVSMHALP